MAEHLTLVSLRKALSARSNVSEKVADDFLAGLTSTIQEGLQKDGSVTVNGLGTFKLQDMPARESVNVTTGERITIAGHKKVVFVADNRTAEEDKSQPARKRKTAVAPEPVDPIKKLGEQAEEIKGILSEIEAIDGSQKTENRPQAEPADKVETAYADRVENAEKHEKPFNPWLTGLITIGVFAMLLIIAYFILRHQIVNWADDMRNKIELKVESQQSIVESQKSKVESEEVKVESQQSKVESEEVKVESQKSIAESEKLPDYYDDSKRKFTEFQATETVGQDSRLAWVAKKRYGEKAYWVFIYEVNRDRLSSPDHVLPGMKLRVPELPKELRDPNDPDTKALLDRLSEKYRAN